ncbi:hypothetical protein E4U41_006683 [Claviceps citrina]|nr:hypothetical protein E4U41_006683 [Claviceps citrina]
MKLARLASLLGAIALVAPVSAAALPRAPFTRMFVPSWTVPIAPGSNETVVVNGTVQQVDAYMQKHYPAWAQKSALAAAASPDEESGSGSGSLAAGTLERRIYIPPPNYMRFQNIMCNLPLPRHAVNEAMGGVQYLYKVRKDRHPMAEAGPRACSKVSCSFDASIIWCNDSDKPKVLASFAEIGMAANGLINSCPPVNQRMSGEAFMFGDWSVIIGFWGCKKDFFNKDAWT